MKRHLWAVFAAACTAAMAAVALVASPAAGLQIERAVQFGSVLAIVTGAVLWARGRRRAWLYEAAGAGSFALGYVVLSVLTRTHHGVPPFPSLTDVFFYLGYIGLIAGGASLIRSRSRRREWANLVDAVIVAAGVGLVVWAFFMAPYDQLGQLPPFVRLVSSGYSVLDLVLLGVWARLAIGPGARNPSYYLLTTCMSCVLIVDVLTTLTTAGAYSGALNPYVSAACFIALGAGALHPSMARLTERDHAPTRLTRRRLTVLAGALAMGPAVLVVKAATGHAMDSSTVVVGSAVMAGLVLLRMVMLLRANERKARRERILREAGVVLVAATTKEEMHEGALAAIVALAGGSGVRASLASGPVDAMTVVASVGTGARPADGRVIDMTALPDGLADVLVDRRPRVAYNTAAVDGPGEGVSVVVLPLVSQNELRGVIAVTSAAPLPVEAVESLSDFASAVALALEAAALTESLHRRKSERRFKALIENSSDLVCVVDEGAALQYVSPAVERVLGYDMEAMLGMDPLTLVHADDAEAALQAFGGAIDGAINGAINGPVPNGAWRTELRVRHADGAWHTMDVTATDLRHEPTVAGIVLNARDVTDRKELEGELRFQALHDTLTGLANRALFADRVTHALQRRSDRQDLVAVLFIDLDDFKTINDSLGHAAGDDLLVAVGARLQECVRLADTPARLGGDEFAILVEDIYTEDQVVDLADRVLEALLRPFDIGGRSVQVGATMGIAIDTARATSADILLRNADVAMYLAKERGKARFEIFEESMHDVAVERMELRNDMPAALASGQFAVHYQPIVDLNSGVVQGVEALLRWNHPTRGPVRPDVFIPVAEQSGFILTLGSWVLDRACADLRRWREADPAAAALTMSVNVSVRQLEQHGLAADVAGALARHGLDPHHLTLEVTESVLMADTEALRDRLTELRALGVKIALDDFGTGYSSLKYLDRLPLDTVKIDRSFVADLSTKAHDPAVVRAVIDLAGQLDLGLVAEGIEQAAQLDVLRAMGCQMGQGYYFARPMPAGEVVQAVAGRALAAAAALALAATAGSGR
jgi:diguanylate cyclase (GGDEF)-like protein/PAS domain S-box-containing protein